MGELKGWSRCALDIGRYLRPEKNRINDFRYNRLMELIQHSYSNVPFYHQWFRDAGIRPGDIQRESDLVNLPPVSKIDMKQAAPEDLLARGSRSESLVKNATTGSTGIPFIVLRNRREDFFLHLLRMRIMFYYGLRMTHRMLRIKTGMNLDIPLSWRISQKLGAFRQSILGTEQPPEILAGSILKGSADIISGYTGILARVSQILYERNTLPLPPRFMVSGADVMTPFARDIIQKAFRSRVYDSYESIEAGPIAWECKETGLYHLCDDGVIVEILRDGKPVSDGEKGEVAITALNSRTMPFIRFKIGDYVTAGPPRCPCGAPFSTIRNIQGKIQDYFRLPDGREFYPWEVSHLIFRLVDKIMRYQIVQETVDKICLYIVPIEDFPDREAEFLRSRIISALGGGIHLDLKIVSDIPPGPGGKYYYQRSRINSLYTEF